MIVLAPNHIFNCHGCVRQTEIARRAGISQSMVARIEAGSVDPGSAP